MSKDPTPEEWSQLLSDLDTAICEFEQIIDEFSQSNMFLMEDRRGNFNDRERKSTDP